ncbi:hypothetical protein N0V94_007120 [Neodidymelliopsis sp. IMI 364377]|nr:hypothetical protein N0V94_007120 [Neodidymelliopsis sp. IMI 364377]
MRPMNRAKFTQVLAKTFVATYVAISRRYETSNKTSAVVDKNLDISPIKLESTSADANDDLDSHNTKVLIKVEASQVELKVDLKPKSSEMSSQSNQSASGADLSATDICDQIIQTATVKKNDGSDGFQIFQKNCIMPSYVEEHGTRKLFSGFRSDAKDSIATSLILGKHNISFDFSTDDKVQTGSANRKNCKTMTAKSQVKNGSSSMKSSSAVISQPEKRITGLKAVLKHIIPFENHDYIALPDMIENFLAGAVCDLHRRVALSQPKANPRINVLRDLVVSLPNVSKRNIGIFKEWLEAILGHSLPSFKAITNCDLPSFPQIATIPALSTSRRSEMLVNATEAVIGTVTPSYSPKFNPYKAERSDSSSIAEALQSQIVVPLSETDKKEGLVYIFWDQQNFGMIKVGRTNDLDKRLEQWSRQCKMTYHYHQSSRNGSLLKVPHVQRIEKLIHIELVNYRKKRHCEGCGKTHIEWFDIDEAKAVKVYQKWRDWIVKEPYAEDQTGKWTIRPEMLDTLAKVCEPVIFEKTKKESPQLRCRSAQVVMKRQKARKST